MAAVDCAVEVCRSAGQSEPLPELVAEKLQAFRMVVALRGNYAGKLAQAQSLCAALESAQVCSCDGGTTCADLPPECIKAAQELLKTSSRLSINAVRMARLHPHKLQSERAGLLEVGRRTAVCLGERLNHEQKKEQVATAKQRPRPSSIQPPQCFLLERLGERHLCEHGCYYRAYEPARRMRLLQLAVVERGACQQLLRGWRCVPRTASLPAFNCRVRAAHGTGAEGDVDGGGGGDDETGADGSGAWRAQSPCTFDFVSENGATHASVPAALRALGLEDRLEHKNLLALTPEPKRNLARSLSSEPSASHAFPNPCLENGSGVGSPVTTACRCCSRWRGGAHAWLQPRCERTARKRIKLLSESLLEKDESGQTLSGEFDQKPGSNVEEASTTDRDGNCVDATRVEAWGRSGKARKLSEASAAERGEGVCRKRQPDETESFEGRAAPRAARHGLAIGTLPVPLQRSRFFESAGAPRSSLFVRSTNAESAWRPPRSPFGLLEELLWDRPWALLLSCVLLNQTSRVQVDPVLSRLLDAFPDASALARADLAKVERLLRPLGLHRRRAVAVRDFSAAYLRGNWRAASELPAIGRYASDAHAIFCLGRAREIVPRDHALSWYCAWISAIDGAEIDGEVARQLTDEPPQRSRIEKPF